MQVQVYRPKVQGGRFQQRHLVKGYRSKAQAIQRKGQRKTETSKDKGREESRPLRLASRPEQDGQSQMSIRTSFRNHETGSWTILLFTERQTESNSRDEPLLSILQPSPCHILKRST